MAAHLAGNGVLIVAVVDGAQTQAVLFGPDGVTAGLAAGGAVLLCPTIAPEDTEDAAARLAGRLATQWMRQGATA